MEHTASLDVSVSSFNGNCKMLAVKASTFIDKAIDILEYRLLKGTLFASLVLSMAAATKKEKKRRSLPLEGWR